MAIFIALIFQVLFVFFAMIVNVGLIVHDKINLQNSVDIAAYYAAQRQAEILNGIAHHNYQIRQAWKLLSWRIRVLGDLGYRGHPLQQTMGNNLEDRGAYGETGAQSYRVPSICINHGAWGSRQNACYDGKISIPQIPEFKMINIFSPFNFIFSMGVDTLRDAQDMDGTKTGPRNFNIALRWMHAYRVQVARSKEVIRAYADLLSEGATDFKDISGHSVSAGAYKTLMNNLTRANLRAMAEEESFKIFNSLGVSEGNRKRWLNEVPIFPVVFYTDLLKVPGGWSGEVKPIIGTDQANRPQHNLNPNDTEDTIRNEPNSVDDLFHSIFGVEKNPWMMAYVGVYAETRPRKPYLPFGKPITLKAKAFAKPFGGRIGPWHYAIWPQDSTKSFASNSQRTDPLTPIPLDPDSGAVNASPAERNLAVPNYSRFPGDRLGLNSMAALALFKEKFDAHIKSGDTIHPAFYSGTPLGDDGLAFAAPTLAEHNKMNPSLGYPAPWIREFEMAAIAPDLFDATYYSIDREYYRNYSQPSLNARVIQNVSFDAGSKKPDHIKSAADQVSVATRVASVNMNFWKIKDPHHLLTGWAPSGPFRYAFPPSFGKCDNESSDAASVPGKCAVGGRVGYSVKIVSEDYLQSTSLPLGGQGVVGKLKNPPPSCTSASSCW